MRYLALGDSYTIGERVDAAERWPVQLVSLLRAEMGFESDRAGEHQHHDRAEGHDQAGVRCRAALQTRDETHLVERDPSHSDEEHEGPVPAR